MVHLRLGFGDIIFRLFGFGSLVMAFALRPVPLFP